MSAEASDVFCLLPWIHVFAAADGRVWPCCATAGGPPAGTLRSQTLAEMADAPALRQLRRRMLKGERSQACGHCYGIDEAGGLSLRRWANEAFKERLPSILETGADGGLREFRLPFLHVQFSNVCNLKCRICGPQASTSWYEDARSLGADAPAGVRHWRQDDGVRPLPVPSRPLVPSEQPEKLWNQLEELLPGAEEIWLSGGEPVLSPDVWRLLDRLAELGRFEVRLRLHTNFSTTRLAGRDILSLLDRFKDVVLSASLDAMGPRAEYLRSGLRWEDVLRHRERVRVECPRLRFAVYPVVGLMNVLHLPDFHRDWLERGLVEPGQFWPYPLFEPEELALTVLPAELKEIAGRKLESHSAFLETRPGQRGEARAFRALAALMRSRDDSALLSRFRLTARRLDALRGEDLPAVFPELAGLF